MGAQSHSGFILVVSKSFGGTKSFLQDGVMSNAGHNPWGQEGSCVFVFMRQL